MDEEESIFASPLKGYEHLPHPPKHVNPYIISQAPDKKPNKLTSLTSSTFVNKSNKEVYVNEPTGVLSDAYTAYPSPVLNSNSETGTGFDVHILYLINDPVHVSYIRDLVIRIRLEFPELAIFVPNETPAGPFPTASFEVDLLTPAQFGAFVPWIVVNRGPLSALIHPNTTGDVENDHVGRAMWLGERWPLNLGFFSRGRGGRRTDGSNVPHGGGGIIRMVLG